MGDYEEGEVDRFNSAKFIICGCNLLIFGKKKGHQDQFIRDLGARLE